MEEYSSQFFISIPDEEGNVKHQIPEDKKLELRLGPPGEFFGSKKCNFSRFEEPTKRVFSSSWLRGSLNSPGSCREAQVELQGQEKKRRTSPATNIFHKRVAPAPVVGWPPIRSFRKNLKASGHQTPKPKPASSESPPPDTKTQKQNPTLNPENSRKDVFLKINMEGVPIGRKINLNAYDSYEKLSIAVDQLFGGLLAAQRNGEEDEAEENAKSVAGGGEYTLVYEDNEGDRVLVGDVPWHMFVSTAKRLRVLKSSDLSTSHFAIRDIQASKTN